MNIVRFNVRFSLTYTAKHVKKVREVIMYKSMLHRLAIRK